MRISTAREFRDTTGLLRSRTPILVTRRGRVAGIFFPRPELTLPIELKRELYNMLSSDVARQLKRRKVSEDDVLKDFEASRKKRLQLDTLLLTLAALPVTVLDRSEYEHHLPEAKRRIGKRDPDDVDVLALALDLNLAVWSNDNDFEDAGVE